MKKFKEPKYITEYDDFVKICELSKERSPLKILFCTNDLPDKWLIDVVVYRNKTGRIVEEYGIIQKDFKKHINFCGLDGHNIITNF